MTCSVMMSCRWYQTQTQVIVQFSRSLLTVLLYRQFTVATCTGCRFTSSTLLVSHQHITSSVTTLPLVSCSTSTGRSSSFLATLKTLLTHNISLTAAHHFSHSTHFWDSLSALLSCFSSRPIMEGYSMWVPTDRLRPRPVFTRVPKCTQYYI